MSASTGIAAGKLTLVDELALDLEQRRLTLVDEHEPRDAEAGELPAELRADRAARARDEHGLALDVRGDGVQIDLDLLAPEHVLDLHRADLPSEVQVAGDQLVQARQRLHGDVLRAAGLDDLTADRARRRRDRDQHLVRLVVAQHMRDVVGRAEDADAVDAVAALARVVVDEADRRVVQLPVALHLAHHQLSRVPRADDQNLLAVRDERAGLRPLDQRAREQARARDEREQQQEVERRDSARQPRGVLGRERVEHEVGERGGDGDTARSSPHVARRDVAPPAVVEAEEHERAELQRDDERDDAASRADGGRRPASTGRSAGRTSAARPR